MMREGGRKRLAKPGSSNTASSSWYIIFVSSMVARAGRSPKDERNSLRLDSCWNTPCAWTSMTMGKCGMPGIHSSSCDKTGQPPGAESSTVVPRSCSLRLSCSHGQGRKGIVYGGGYLALSAHARARKKQSRTSISSVSCPPLFDALAMSSSFFFAAASSPSKRAFHSL